MSQQFTVVAASIAQLREGVSMVYTIAADCDWWEVGAIVEGCSDGARKRFTEKRNIGAWIKKTPRLEGLSWVIGFWGAILEMEG